MAILSMTGFGRGTATVKGITAEVEISTVNRRQLDVRVNLPRGLSGLEAQVSGLVQKQLTRGQVNVQVRISEGKAGGAVVEISEEAAAAGVRALRRTAKKLGLSASLDATALLQIPGVVRFRDLAEEPDRVVPAMQHAVRDALEALVRMRQREGAAMGRDLARRVTRLRRSLAQIEARGPKATKHYASVLHDRLQKAGLEANMQDPQVLRELVLFAERVDTSEEVVRLKSHFEHAEALMAEPAPAGRAMDFLCQEMFREINTIGAKSNDAAIARHVVKFKTELECIREQVQNVE